MNLFDLTRELVKIDSTTPHESQVSALLEEQLSQLMIPFPGKMERIEVAPGRWNVFAHWGEPVVTLSSHMDTV
ncbi:MAG: M20/M25/M40 family metallo-hydrolase, partial [Candidatus Acidiferrales bacterium]